MISLNWADGRNYDPAQLFLFTADAGFIIGEGVLGVTPLGPDAVYGQIPFAFTSIVVRDPAVVEQGLFVHRDLQTCTLTCTDPASEALVGQRIYIRYGPAVVGKEVFLGTIVAARRSESVDIWNAFRTGNTDVRTHRVALTCTATDEFFASQLAPPRAFDETVTYTDRLKSYLSLTTASFTNPSDYDIDGGIGYFLQHPLNSVLMPIVTVLDEARTLLDTFRYLGARVNQVYRYLRPTNAINTEGTGVPFSGADTLVSGLRFSDDPDDLTDLPSATYNNKNHVGLNVSFTELEYDEDPSMFATGITVVANGTTYGPYLTEGTNRRTDVEYDMGTLATATARVEETVRSWVSSLPLKAKPYRFPRRMIAPLQSIAQIQNRMPGMTRLTRDGVTERVAVIGTTHTITPQPGRWMVEYDLAPHHLLSREGDRDPSVPRGVVITQPGGAGSAVRVQWSTPNSLPRSRTLYRHILWNGPPAGSWNPSTPFDTEFAAKDTIVVTSEQPGDAHSVDIPFASLALGAAAWWVCYTTVETPGVGGFSDTHLWSYPVLYDYTVI